jgi:hypothetical protein
VVSQALSFAEDEGGVDQREMCESLWEVAELAAADRVVFLGERGRSRRQAREPTRESACRGDSGGSTVLAPHAVRAASGRARRRRGSRRSTHRSRTAGNSTSRSIRHGSRAPQSADRRSARSPRLAPRDHPEDVHGARQPPSSAGSSRAAAGPQLPRRYGRTRGTWSSSGWTMRQVSSIVSWRVKNARSPMNAA